LAYMDRFRDFRRNVASKHEYTKRRAVKKLVESSLHVLETQRNKQGYVDRIFHEIREVFPNDTITANAILEFTPDLLPHCDESSCLLEWVARSVDGDFVKKIEINRVLPIYVEYIVHLMKVQSYSEHPLSVVVRNIPSTFTISMRLICNDILSNVEAFRIHQSFFKQLLFSRNSYLIPLTWDALLDLIDEVDDGEKIARWCVDLIPYFPLSSTPHRTFLPAALNALAPCLSEYPHLREDAVVYTIQLAFRLDAFIPFQDYSSALSYLFKPTSDSNFLFTFIWLLEQEPLPSDQIEIIGFVDLICDSFLTEKMRSEESTIALQYAKFALLNSINSSSADVQIRAKEVMNKLCDILDMSTSVIETDSSKSLELLPPVSWYSDLKSKNHGSLLDSISDRIDTLSTPLVEVALAQIVSALAVFLQQENIAIKTCEVIASLATHHPFATCRFLPIFLSLMQSSRDSELLVAILYTLPSLCTKPELVPAVANFIEGPMVDHNSHLRALGLKLLTDLWKLQPGTFDCLLKKLTSIQDESREFRLARISCVLEICKGAPEEAAQKLLNFVQQGFKDVSVEVQCLSMECLITLINAEQLEFYLVLEALGSDIQDSMTHPFALVKFMQFLTLGKEDLQNPNYGDVVEVLSESVVHDNALVREAALTSLSVFLECEFDDSMPSIQDQTGVVTETLLLEDSQELLEDLILSEETIEARQGLVKLLRAYFRREMLSSGEQKKIEAKLKHAGGVQHTEITRRLKKAGQRIYGHWSGDRQNVNISGASLFCHPVGGAVGWRDKGRQAKAMEKLLVKELRETISQDWSVRPMLFHGWIELMERVVATLYDAQVALVEHKGRTANEVEAYQHVSDRVCEVLEKLETDDENVQANALLCRGAMCYHMNKQGQHFVAEPIWEFILDTVDGLEEESYWLKHSGLVALAYASVGLPLRRIEATINTLVSSLDNDLAHGWELFGGAYGLGICAQTMVTEKPSQREKTLLAHIVRTLVMSVINALDGLLDIDCHDHGYDPFRKKPKISARVCGGNITEQWSYCFIGCVLGLVSCLGVLDKNREFLALKNLYRLFEELTRVAPRVGDYSLTAGSLLGLGPLIVQLYSNQILKTSEIDHMLKLVFGFAKMEKLPFGATSALGSCLHGLHQAGYAFQEDYFQDAISTFSKMVTARERELMARREGVFGIASLLGVEVSTPLSPTASSSPWASGEPYRDTAEAKPLVKKMLSIVEDEYKNGQGVVAETSAWILACLSAYCEKKRTKVATQKQEAYAVSDPLLKSIFNGVEDPEKELVVRTCISIIHGFSKHPIRNVHLKLQRLLHCEHYSIDTKKAVLSYVIFLSQTDSGVASVLSTLCTLQRIVLLPEALQKMLISQFDVVLSISTESQLQNVLCSWCLHSDQFGSLQLSVWECISSTLRSGVTLSTLEVVTSKIIFILHNLPFPSSDSDVTLWRAITRTISPQVDDDFLNDHFGLMNMRNAKAECARHALVHLLFARDCDKITNATLRRCAVALIGPFQDPEITAKILPLFVNTIADLGKDEAQTQVFWIMELVDFFWQSCQVENSEPKQINVMNALSKIISFWVNPLCPREGRGMDLAFQLGTLLPKLGSGILSKVVDNVARNQELRSLYGPVWKMILAQNLDLAKPKQKIQVILKSHCREEQETDV